MDGIFSVQFWLTDEFGAEILGTRHVDNKLLLGSEIDLGEPVIAHDMHFEFTMPAGALVPCLLNTSCPSVVVTVAMSLDRHSSDACVAYGPWR